MSRDDGIRDFFRERLERYRFGLASSTADGFLALLGLLTGLIAGFTIVGFRVTVDAVQQLYLSGQPAEAFETLDPALRVLLPLAGGLLLGVMFRSLPPGARTVGSRSWRRWRANWKRIPGRASPRHAWRVRSACPRPRCIGISPARRRCSKR